MLRNPLKKRGFTDRMMDLFWTPRGSRKSPVEERRLAVEPLETRTLLAIVTMTASDATFLERDEGGCPVTFAIEAEDGEDLRDAGQVHVSYSIDGLESHEYSDGGCMNGGTGGGYVTIWAENGQTEETITIPFFNDAIDDGNDVCTISLSGAVASNTWSGIGFTIPDEQPDTTVTILDDDSWVIEVEAIPDEIVERDGVSGYSISRVDDGSGESGDTSYAIAVDFTMSGAADYGADYNLRGDNGYSIPRDWNSTTQAWEWHVTLPAGGGGAGVGLRSVNNAVREADEDAVLSISGATSVNGQDSSCGGGCGGGCCMAMAYQGPDGTYGQTGPDASVTIQDDDGWALEIERTSGEVIVERTGEASLVLRRVDDGDGRSGDTSYGILVDLDPSGGAAAYGTDFGLYDEDGYYLGYWTATIPAGATTTGLQLVSNNDHLWEADEDAVIAVTGGTSVGVSGGVFAAGQAHPDASVLILDDDHWVVTLEEAGEAGDPHTVIQEEGETSAGLLLSRTHEVMTPSRTGDTSYPIDVTFDYAGKAKASDYSMIESVVQADGSIQEVSNNGGTPSFQIQEGQTQKAIEVKAVDDEYIELLLELLDITITDAAYGGESYVIGTEDTVEIDLKDNDEPILRLVSYEDANPYKTDPIYVGDEFQFINEDKLVTSNHWIDRSGNGLIDVPGEGDVGDKRYPVTYERSSSGADSRFRVKAQWDGRVEDGYTMTVQAIGPDSMQVPMSAVTASSFYGTIETGQIESTGEAFPSTVKYYSEFTLTWQFSIDGETPLRPAGENSNEMYVTHNVPIDDRSRHTSFHLGTVAADGDSDLLDVVNDAWGEFTDLDVARRDGTTMTYYGDPITEIASVTELLTNADGSCVAWQGMLLDVYFAQGINAEQKQFWPKNSSEGILINDYSGFDQEGTLEKAGAVYSVSGVADYSGYTHLGRVVKPRIVAGDITDQAGIPGQSNLDPTSYFNYHAIVRLACDFDGDGDTSYRYFDPSYGVEYADWAYQCSYLYTEAEYDSFAVDDFVSSALAGLYLPAASAVVDETVIGVDLNGDESIDDPAIVPMVFLMREGNSSDIELRSP